MSRSLEFGLYDLVIVDPVNAHYCYLFSALCPLLTTAMSHFDVIPRGFLATTMTRLREIERPAKSLRCKRLLNFGNEILYYVRFPAIIRGSSVYCDRLLVGHGRLFTTAPRPIVNRIPAPLMTRAYYTYLITKHTNLHDALMFRVRCESNY